VAPPSLPTPPTPSAAAPAAAAAAAAAAALASALAAGPAVGAPRPPPDAGAVTVADYRLPVPPGALHAIALDPAFQATYLTGARGVRGGVTVGEWRPGAAATAVAVAAATATALSSARRSVRYMTSTGGGGGGGGGVGEGVRVECVEAQTAVPGPPGGEKGSAATAASQGWALRIAAGTPGLPLYGAAFHTEVTLVCTPADGPVAGGAPPGPPGPPPSWSRITVWGRVVWSARVLGLARRALERAAGGGLGAAYSAHAAALGRAAGGVAPVPEAGSVGLAGIKAAVAVPASVTALPAPGLAQASTPARSARAAARAARAATRDGVSLALALLLLATLSSLARSLSGLRVELAGLRGEVAAVRAVLAAGQRKA